MENLFKLENLVSFNLFICEILNNFLVSDGKCGNGKKYTKYFYLSRILTASFKYAQKVLKSANLQFATLESGAESRALSKKGKNTLRFMSVHTPKSESHSRDGSQFGGSKMSHTTKMSFASPSVQDLCITLTIKIAKIYFCSQVNELFKSFKLNE